MRKNGLMALTVALMMVCGLSAFAQAKPASIKLMVDGTFPLKENGEKVVVDGFKALTGIDLILNHPIHNEYYTKVDLAFVTGDIPDVILLGHPAYMRYAAAGQLWDLSKLYDKSNIKKNVKDQAIVDALRIDGKLYGIPAERGGGTITYIRGDWLEKLGMKVPTNYAEFLNMLRAFKNKNPDGLTPDQVIPITGPGLVNSEFPLDIYLREFYQDANPDYVMVKGKWVDGMLQPNMVAALERMRSAYAEGLIDKEIITNKTSTAREKFYAGKVGVFNYWSGTWNETIQKNTEANIPGAKVIPIPAIKETKYIERVPWVYAIPKKVKNPETIFKYWHEFILDGGKGQTFASFGVEGTFYKVVDGKNIFQPSIVDQKKPFTKGFISPNAPINKWDSHYTSNAIVAASQKMFEENNKPVSLIPHSEDGLEVIKDVNVLRGKFIAKIVFGELSVKDGIAQYQAETKKFTDVVLKGLGKN